MAYWSEDGVVDLTLGLNLVVVGGLFLIGYALPKGSSFARNYIWLAQAGWLACGLGMRYGIKALKERVTMPRGGYVALQEPGEGRTWALWGLSFAAMAMVWVVTRLVRDAGWDRLTAPLVGILFALALAFPGWRYKLPHMIWLAVFSLLLGAGVYSLQRGFGESLCLMMIGLGTATSFVGALRLSRFIASHPLGGE
jgi:hypothetical protein